MILDQATCPQQVRLPVCETAGGWKKVLTLDMANGNPMLRHWHQEVAVFDKNLGLLQAQSVNADAIHDLRVAIKKLRSYFKLYLASFERKNTMELFSKTKELFSALGKHRNIGISRQLLLRYVDKSSSSLSSLILYLQLLQEQAADYTRRAIQQYDRTELTQLTALLDREIAELSPEESKNKLKDSVAFSLKNVAHNSKHFDERYHLIRKDLKDVLYWTELFEDNLVLTSSQAKLVDKILDHLGRIQDHEVMIKNTRHFRKTILSKGNPEFALIKKIEDKAKRKQADLLEKADRMTRRLLGEEG